MRTTKAVRVAAATTALLALGATPALAASTPAEPQRAAAAISIDLGLHLGGKPTAHQIDALFDQWNAALATGKPSVVADLYAPNAVLLPTVSNRVRTDRAGIVNYFETFLAKSPRGTILSSTTTVLDRTTAVRNGTYRFAFSDGSTVDARFTYVYEKINGKWLIVTHHSSAMPEK